MFEVLAIKIFNLFCIFCTSTVAMIGDVLFFIFFHLKFGFLKLFNYICQCSMI